jgi:hypothetical protein
VLRAGLTKHNNLQKGGQFISRRDFSDSKFQLICCQSGNGTTHRNCTADGILESWHAFKSTRPEVATLQDSVRPPAYITLSASLVHNSSPCRCAAQTHSFLLGYESQTQTNDSCGGGDRLQ